MPQITELDTTTDEDAGKVYEFAVENAKYLSMTLCDVANAIKDDNVQRAVARYSLHMLEAYVSGLNAGFERGMKEARESQ